MAAPYSKPSPRRLTLAPASGIAHDPRNAHGLSLRQRRLWRALVRAWPRVREHDSAVLASIFSFMAGALAAALWFNGGGCG